MKLLAIGGEPGVGKSRLVREMMKELAATHKGEAFKFGLMNGTRYGNVWFFGQYTGHEFDGTDRLSMAVQENAQQCVAHLKHYQPDSVVVFEGARLFNGSFLGHVKDTGVRVEALRLAASSMAIMERRMARGVAQTPASLKARKTQLDNVCSTLPWVETVLYGTDEECEAVRRRCRSFIGA